MSNAVFPTLPGLTWDVIKSPRWNTSVQQSVGGKEVRAAFFSSPIWRWTLKYEVLRQASAFLELQQLVGFFNARQGRFDSFLFSDPLDNAVVGQNFGTGNGSTTAFQLVRDFGAGGFTRRERTFTTSTIPRRRRRSRSTVFTKTVTTDYTIGATGIVTFTAAPAGAAALTWDGFYYWRVRFDQDSADFKNFLSQLWDLQQLTLVSVK
jgi:uncharacterized protein (TIGR02217 family)